MWDLDDFTPEDELVQAQQDDDILARQRVERERKEREAREAVVDNHPVFAEFTPETRRVIARNADAADEIVRERQEAVWRQQGEVHFTRLRNGSWGVRGPAEDVYEGNEVTVVRRDGGSVAVTVGRIVWTDGVVTLANKR